MSEAAERANRFHLDAIASAHMRAAREAMERKNAECFAALTHKTEAGISRWNAAMREITAKQQRQMRGHEQD